MEVFISAPQSLEIDDPSLNSINQNFLRAWRSSRPRPFTGSYLRLVEKVGDPYISEMFWLLYGESSFGVLDRHLEINNPKRPWWKLRAERERVSSLIVTKAGKARVWAMLHEDSAWV